MGSIIATIVMLYGGWKNWTWLSPIYAVLLLTPLTVYGLLKKGSWRAEAGIPFKIDWTGVYLSALAYMAFFYFAFALARGLRIWNNKRQLKT